MKQATLIRIEHGKQETIGVLILDGRIVCYILEDPDRDNVPFFSRIPEGSYKCRRVQSSRFGDTFEIEGVVGRDLIRFHWGNTHRDTEGCPLTGMYPTWWNNEDPAVRALMDSKKAFRKLMAKLEGETEFQLNIISVQT